jgi:hypothetical protein
MKLALFCDYESRQTRYLFGKRELSCGIAYKKFHVPVGTSVCTLDRLLHGIYMSKNSSKNYGVHSKFKWNHEGRTQNKITLIQIVHYL